MSVALIWIVIGILLLISELLLTSVVAVFIGVGAIITGLLLHWEIINEISTQFAVFGISSAVLLVLARGKLKALFKGYTADNDPSSCLSI